jgi:hypothetical protein
MSFDETLLDMIPTSGESEDPETSGFDEPEAGAAADSGPIKIELVSGQGPHQSLDEPLDLSVRVTNVSDEAVWMVGVLPGSGGLRYPQYSAEIEGPSGPVRQPFAEGLDYARGLQAEDFVRLHPGESFDPQEGKRYIPIQELAWFQPTEPGRYRLRLRFDATAGDARHWLGQTPVRDRTRVERLIREVPQVEVWSNILEIECE